jgi:hypothetical protein
MNDLERAKTLLIKRQLTLIIVKKGQTLFETKSHRISGFLNAIEQLDKKLDGASIADKVAGKAVALLSVYAGVSAVYAETLSKEAKDLFEQNGITHEWKALVDNILDESKSDTCPFEKEATKIPNPEEAYERFKALQRNLKACR